MQIRSQQPEPESLTVMMGEIGVAAAPCLIRTILGSCVGIALWDRRVRVGGIAHVVLPDSRGETTLPGKFADTAVPHLIERIVVKGGMRANLVARIAGGANMFNVISKAQNVGEKNQEAVISILKRMEIPILSEDLGGTKGRRMTLDTQTGEIRVEFPSDRISEAPKTIRKADVAK
jgi:chemotaxis protein CheD